MRECITHHDACHCREAKATSDMAILRAENTRLRAALEAVLAVADRKTKEFDAARAALATRTSSESEGG